MSNGFAADLFKIWKVGDQYFPQVAQALGEARSALLRSEGGDDALRRPDALGSGLGPAQPGIDLLRDQLSRMLQETVDNLTTTADVLRMAAERYAETDHNAGREFQRRAEAER